MCVSDVSAFCPYFFLRIALRRLNKRTGKMEVPADLDQLHAVCSLGQCPRCETLMCMQCRELVQPGQKHECPQMWEEKRDVAAERRAKKQEAANMAAMASIGKPCPYAI